jgi:TRAP-type C4-dicarboxylate transport system permease small subunit
MTAVQLALQVAASDPRPDDNNVVAGWTGFVVLIALIIAVVFILRSFTKQLKKVDRAKEAGVFGDEPQQGAEAEQPPTSVEHDR